MASIDGTGTVELLSEGSEWVKENPDCQTILVTGGTGLIGCALQKVLSLPVAPPSDGIVYQIGKKEKWIFVGSKAGDLRDRNAVKSIIEKNEPTMVLHLAAKVGGLYSNMAHNLEFLRDNLIINDNVLHTCYEFGVKKVVSCLSTCIFPDKTTYPIDETMLHNGPPHESNYGYSYAKRMIDVQNRAYNQTLTAAGKERLFTAIIPCNIYGLHDNFDLRDSHVIPGLIHKMYLANQRQESEYTIYGTGSPLRQFIFSDDLAKLSIWIIRNYTDPEPVILSVDESDEVTIKTVAEMIASNFPNLKTIKTDPSQADGQHKKTANNAKLRSLVPSFKFTPLDEAIKQTVEWFNAHYESKGQVRLGH